MYTYMNHIEVTLYRLYESYLRSFHSFIINIKPIHTIRSNNICLILAPHILHYVGLISTTQVSTSARCIYTAIHIYIYTRAFIKLIIFKLLHFPPPY